MSYLRERLTFVPWALIPPVLYMLGRGPGVPFHGWTLALLYAVVLQLRVLDDYFCFSMDRARGKPEAYLRCAPALLLPWCAAFTSVAVLAAGFALPRGALVATILFLAAHPAIYRWLRGRSGLWAVSLAKYPFLLFMTASLNDRPSYLWPAAGTALFLIREACEELLGMRSRLMEALVVVLLISARWWGAQA
jgi:hypothetical protein